MGKALKGFIQLTAVSATGAGAVWVNFDQVTAMSSLDDGTTKLRLAGGGDLVVRETPAQIFEQGAPEVRRRQRGRESPQAAEGADPGRLTKSRPGQP
jgi:hypothetical protein